jgi:hypothetical protein
MASAAAQRTRVGQESGLRRAVRQLLERRPSDPRQPSQPRNHAAGQLGVDPVFARTIEEYLLARRRLAISRAGWRASFRLRR